MRSAVAGRAASTRMAKVAVGMAATAMAGVTSTGRTGEAAWEGVYSDAVATAAELTALVVAPEARS